MKYFLSIFFSILLSPVVIGAVDAPDLRCVSVRANNTIDITWIAPADPNNEFVEYELYFATAIGGPYTKISVPGGITTTTYNHTVNGGANSFFYYMQTLYNDGTGNQTSAPSNTAQSIFPQFGAVTDSTAIVVWNRVFDPTIPTAAPNYELERKFFSTNTWVTIASPNYGIETYSDAFKFCSDSVYYRVNITDQSGCVSTSNILKDLFEDNTPPVTPVLDSVTVLPNGRPRVDWKPSSSLDTRGYYVYYYFKPTATYVPRDTILGRLNTGFTEPDALIDTQKDFHDFTVAAFDSCTVPRINVSSGAPDQRTLYLELTPNNCDQTVQLDWNSYINWNNLAGYQVLAARLGQPFDTVFTGGVNDTSYVFTRPDGLTIYCFLVRAITTDESKTSTSNLVCSNASNVVVPKQQYFKQITVEQNNHIKVVSFSDTSLVLTKYVLERSLNPFLGFFPVDEQPYSLNPVVTFMDSSALVAQNSYYYRINLIDSCGVPVYKSVPGNSIYLDGHLTEDSLNVQLEWTPYQSWDSVGSGTIHYRILAVYDGQKTVVDSVGSNQNSYTYALEEDIILGANLCFEIQAFEDSGNVYGFADTVLSNRVCFSKNTKIFVPSAFRPSGINNIFKPTIAYGNLRDYTMTIYNRWGGVVFETNNIDQGWDGMVDGKMAQLGAYVYVIRIQNFSGSYKEQSGTFILLN